MSNKITNIKREKNPIPEDFIINCLNEIVQSSCDIKNKTWRSPLKNSFNVFLNFDVSHVLISIKSWNQFEWFNRLYLWSVFFFRQIIFLTRLFFYLEKVKKCTFWKISVFFEVFRNTSLYPTLNSLR